jgi:hypothetical protein
MERGVLAVLVFGVVAFGAGVPAWAHHSFTAAFDVNQPVKVHGVITQIIRGSSGNLRREWRGRQGRDSDVRAEFQHPAGNYACSPTSGRTRR